MIGTGTVLGSIMAWESATWIPACAGIFCLLAIAVFPQVRKRFRQSLAVMNLSFREGLRLKIFWTVALLTFGVGLLAWNSEADGTRNGRLRLILDACMICAEALGALLVILTAAWSTAREVETRIMHTLSVKPVPRYVLLLGKAGGFFFLQAIYLAFVGGLLFALVFTSAFRDVTRADDHLQPPAKDWSEIHDRYLTACEFHPARGEERAFFRSQNRERAAEKSVRTPEAPKEVVTILPGKSAEWRFSLPEKTQSGVTLRLRFYSGGMYDEKVRVHLAVSGGGGNAAPFYDREIILFWGRNNDLFFRSDELQNLNELTVRATAISDGKLPRPICVPQGEGVLLGLPQDGFGLLLFKALALLAAQGLLLALVVSAWSGVLSFPVAVSLGLLVLLGGELSRHVVDLLAVMEQRRAETTPGSVAESASAVAGMTEIIRCVLLLFPDFRAVGGASAPLEGKLLSWGGLAAIFLWQTFVRGIGWALPGLILFQRREVGR